jgi:hypothetical protein
MAHRRNGRGITERQREYRFNPKHTDSSRHLRLRRKLKHHSWRSLCPRLFLVWLVLYRGKIAYTLTPGVFRAI